jgi:DNA polymerase I-like protein with 3'-5' exonuclease and polymerase domains
LGQSHSASEWACALASTSDFSQSATVSDLTRKQRQQLDVFDSLILQVGIELHIDPPIWQACYTPVSCDVEHDECGVMVGIGLCWTNICYYFTKVTPYLKSVLETTHFIMHNGVSDMEMLRFWGINVRDSQLVFDTMLIGHLLDSSLKSYGLKDMAKRELNIAYPAYDDIVGKRGLKTPRITLDKQPLELVSHYNAMDTYCTYKLYEKQKKAMGI